MLCKHLVASDFNEKSEGVLFEKDSFYLSIQRLSEEQRDYFLGFCKPYVFEIENPSPEKSASDVIVFAGCEENWWALLQKMYSVRLSVFSPFIEAALKMLYNRNLQPIVLPSGKQLCFEKPLIMGIINCNQDSFFPGSRCDTAHQALQIALQMEQDGASLLDIGGESSRPGSVAIPLELELQRILPAIQLIAQQVKIPISIDTTKSAVARHAIDAGADIVNDISALSFDDEMLPFIASEKIPVILMHIKGNPTTMQLQPSYTDLLAEIHEYFMRIVRELLLRGHPADSIILDPGFGFGKNVQDNLFLLNQISFLKDFQLPILVGTSRKSFIGKVLQLEHPNDRLAGTLATTAFGVSKRANLFRVHDVKENVQVAEMAFSIMSFFCDGVYERGVYNEAF